MLGNRWNVKPPLGTRLDFQHPWARNLSAFFPFLDNGGALVQNLTGYTTFNGGNNGNTNQLGSWLNGPSGPALAITTLSARPQNQVPLQLQSQSNYPMSIAMGVRFLGFPTNAGGNQNYFSAGFKAANSNSVLGFYGLLNTTPVNQIQIAYDSNGTSFYSNADTIVLNTDLVYSATVNTTNQIVYKNGNVVASFANAISPALWVPGGSATQFGQNSMTTNVAFYWAAWWNRALTSQEHQAIGASQTAIWQIMQPRRDRKYCANNRNISHWSNSRLCGNTK